MSLYAEPRPQRLSKLMLAMAGAVPSLPNLIILDELLFDMLTNRTIY